jgi:excisionase family DNA binding protein
MKQLFLSRQEAAFATSLSERQIDRLIKDGVIKAFKPYGSRRVLIDPESITQENLQSAKPRYTNFYEIK